MGWVVAFFQAAAVDLDGTLTSRGRVSEEAVTAIDRARQNGLMVVLVTGRIGVELAAEFPDITNHFDVLVLENGAVAVTDGRSHELAAPVDRVLDEALAERGVPFRRGEVLLAIDGEHAAAVVEVIGMLGLDCQIVRNRAAVMVLPAGVTKGTGLGTVLTEADLSLHNTVAVGDAENDLSLFGTAEIGAAVANAVPSVRDHADLVLEREDGAGVAELLAGPQRQWGTALVSTAMVGRDRHLRGRNTGENSRQPGADVGHRTRRVGQELPGRTHGGAMDPGWLLCSAP
jgi:hydroxymethylpyrimidine pyrophosphatase-like HAD family hydrolase